MQKEGKKSIKPLIMIVSLTIHSIKIRHFVQYVLNKGITYTGGITETFDRVKDGSSNGSHGKCTTTVVHDTPWAAIKNCGYMITADDKLKVSIS